ncbi:AAA family ATPase [Pseudanabaena sp. PCC 6802]|uniref:AAA family ATPase n=1 Tax=Pseudanabaena sp. PCC 6802 TaxID=118173 RepID=UPI000346A399|nr:AAA family ATPase [Pseudanabaena sp. PCC 6802]
MSAIGFIHVKPPCAFTSIILCFLFHCRSNIAIVGPNEAGKSSILKALEHLNHNDSFSQSDLTRGKEIQENDVVIEACFLLEDCDREVLSGLYEGANIRQFRVRKLSNGHREYDTIPSIQRDPSHRHHLLSCLKTALDSTELSGLDINNNEEFLAEEVEKLIYELENTDKDLDGNTLQKLNELKSALTLENEEKGSQILNDLCSAIDSLIASEQDIEPNKRAQEMLISRVPKILLFSEDQRKLESTYNLSHSDFSLSPALQNLTNLANLDLANLKSAISKNDQARIGTILNKANDQITRVVQGKWSQSGVKVTLSISNNYTLNVLIEDERRDCTNLYDRSDGLRQFVALINFLEAEHADQKPILLIDEAETHLHYDAQADLMNMFATQQLASKIIYTTHSAGCLPED